MTETAEPVQEGSSVDLGRALGAVLRTYAQAAHDVVDDVPGGPRGYHVMSVANGDACSNQAAIAEQLGIDRTVMTYLVDDLEKAGLVERRPDPADRRARRVVLTAKGRRVLDATAARVAEVERAVLGALAPAEIEVFRTLLGRVAAAGPVTDPGGVCGVPDDASC